MIRNLLSHPRNCAALLCLSASVVSFAVAFSGSGWNLLKGPFKDSRQSVISDMHPHREMDLFQHYAGRIYPANASGASQEQLATVIHRKMAAAGLEQFLDETSRMEEKSAAGFHVERVSVRMRELPADRLDQLIMGIEWIEPVLRFNKLLISRTDQGNLSIEMTVERWSRTLDSNPGV